MGVTRRARNGLAHTDPLSYASTATASAVSPDAAWGVARKIAVALLVIYLAAMIGVFLMLRTSLLMASGNEMSTNRAVFTAINGATLTGFQQTMGLREMRQAGIYGPVVMLLLTLLGSLVSLTVGGLAAWRILRMPHTLKQLASAALTTLALATLSGAAVLTVTGTNVFDALLQAASAFGNSGLYTGTLPTPFSPLTYLVLLPLAVLGGLGLPVLMELGDFTFRGPRLSANSRVVLGMTGAIYLVGFVALLAAQAPVASGAGWPAWRSTLSSCSVGALNARTAGFPFQSPAAFSAAGQWILMVLMLVGAASAGTAGGIKITTLWHLGRGVREALAAKSVHRAVGIAAIWAALYLVALFLGLLLLLTIEPQIPADRLLFLAVSAIGNVGLSHDPVAITGPGLFVLSFLMLVGRLGSLGILWWMAETTPGADVLVG